jgi:hypothetical protein
VTHGDYAKENDTQGRYGEAHDSQAGRHNPSQDDGPPLDSA